VAETQILHPLNQFPKEALGGFDKTVGVRPSGHPEKLRQFFSLRGLHPEIVDFCG
jgi:hypothetical protein